MNHYLPLVADPDLKTNQHHLKYYMFARDYPTTVRYHNVIGQIADQQEYANHNIFVGDHIIEKYDEHTILAKNNFEYQRPQDMQQYIIWTRNPCFDHHNIYQLVKHHIQDQDYIIWTNGTTIYASLPQIRHFHLMIVPTKPSLKLKKIVIVARHGARSPITILPKLDQKCWRGDTNYNLTPNGRDMCVNYGQHIKTVYGDQILFNLQSSVIKSTNTERTIESAQCFFRGLLNLEVTPEIDIRVSGDTKLSATQLHEWYTFGRNIADSTLDLTELKSVIEDLFGYETHHLCDYYDVYSTVQCYLAEHRQLPKYWIQNPKYMDLLEIAACSFYRQLFRNPQFLNIWTHDLTQLVKEIFDDDTINFGYISTHDSVIYPLAYRLSGDIIKLPDFCSSVRYELWASEWNQSLVRIYYNDMFITDTFFSIFGAEALQTAKRYAKRSQ